MLVLGGLLIFTQNLIPAAQAADWFSGYKPTYIHAATSADPIVYVHQNEAEKATVTVKDQADNHVIAKVEDKAEATLDEMKKYVRSAAKEAGLNPNEVEAIINCESRWIADAKGVNRNGSYDLGLWQINSIHKNITDAEKLDYKAATKWAIEKRLRDGNWSAWYCARRLAIR